MKSDFCVKGQCFQAVKCSINMPNIPALLKVPDYFLETANSHDTKLLYKAPLLVYLWLKCLSKHAPCSPNTRRAGDSSKLKDVYGVTLHPRASRSSYVYFNPTICKCQTKQTDLCSPKGGRLHSSILSLCWLEFAVFTDPTACTAFGDVKWTLSPTCW